MSINKVCAAMDNVRLSPRSEVGHLVLVRDQAGQNLLVWTPHASEAVEAMADDWQSVTFTEEMHMRPLPISAKDNSAKQNGDELRVEEGDVVIPMDTITSISTDEAAKCLMISANGLFMFHFLEGGSPTHALSLISAAIESEHKEEVKKKAAEDPFEGDFGLKLLSSFADMKNYYFDSATNFLNNVLAAVSPGHEKSAGEGSRNPWIAEREVDLPLSRFTGKHLNTDFLRSFTKEDGSVPNAQALIKIAHFAGLDSSIRRRLWLAMLNVIPLNVTREEADVIEKRLREEYLNISPKELSAETLSRIDKDVERTDRQIFYPGSHSTPINELPRLEILRQVLINYCRKDAALRDAALDYVQGMNDLAAPLVYVIGDEALCFHAFSNLMSLMTVH